MVLRRCPASCRHDLPGRHVLSWQRQQPKLRQVTYVVVRRIVSFRHFWFGLHHPGVDGQVAVVLSEVRGRERVGSGGRVTLPSLAAGC